MTPNLILPLAAVVPGLLLLVYFNARHGVPCVRVHVAKRSCFSVANQRCARS